MDNDKIETVDKQEAKPPPKRRSVGSKILQAIDLKVLAARLDAEIESSGIMDMLDRPDAPSVASRIVQSAFKVDGPVLVDALKEVINDV